MGVNCSYSINHNQVKVLSYSKYSLLFTCSQTCNLQMISLKSTLTKCLYPLWHVSCQTIQSEFLGLINPMSISIYEKLFITIMYDFYLSSYCPPPPPPFNFFGYWFPYHIHLYTGSAEQVTVAQHMCYFLFDNVLSYLSL